MRESAIRIGSEHRKKIWQKKLEKLGPLVKAEDKQVVLINSDTTI